MNSPSSASTALKRSFQPLPAAAAAAALLLILAAFWPTLLRTAIICWNNDNYSHGVLLPFVAAYLLWDRGIPHNLRGSSEPGISLLGAALFAAGLPIALLGEVSEILFVQWFSFFPVLLGAVLLIFGTRLGLHFASPLALLFLAKPIPDALSPALFNSFQSFAAEASAAILEMLEIPVYLRGNVIELPGMQLLVEEACSGIRSLMTMLTVAFVVLLLARSKALHSAVLVAAAIALAVVLNIVRVTATGILARSYGREAATGFFHSFSGIAVFIVGLALLYGLALLLGRRGDKK